MKKHCSKKWVMHAHFTLRGKGFEEKQKKLKKAVDKAFAEWYSIEAVA